MASMKGNNKSSPGKNALTVNKRKAGASQAKRRPPATHGSKGGRKPAKKPNATGRKTNATAAGNPNGKRKSNAPAAKQRGKTKTAAGKPNSGKQSPSARRGGKTTRGGKPNPSLKTGRNKLGKKKKNAAVHEGKRQTPPSPSRRPGGINSLTRKKWNRNVDKNWRANSVNAMPLKHRPGAVKNWDRELAGIEGTDKRRDLRDYKKIFTSSSSTWNDKIYRRRFRSRRSEGPRKVVSDVAKLIDLHVVNQAVGGIRTLATLATKTKTKKNLLDDAGQQDAVIFLQVTLCKLPQYTQQLRLANPLTISVTLPHSINGDDTEVLLITRDLEKGIRADHEDSLQHYLDLLQKHGANTLVNEVVPLRQLKVEYKEYEAKRLLANRVEVVLCDDSVMRLVPKFLGKHFYKRKRSPIQVDLKANNLRHEITRALSVSQIKFTFKGNCAQMKVGRLGQTDEQIAENVAAAVLKLAARIPGGWKNVQNLGLKLGKSSSIPFFARINSVKNVAFIPPKTVNIVKDTVSGIITTRPTKVVTVYPDGSVGVMAVSKRTLKRLPQDEKPSNNDETVVSGANEAVGGSEKRKLVEEEDEEEEDTQQVPKKRGGGGGKKQMKKKKKKNINPEDDLESDEDDLEERELAYLRRRSSGQDTQEAKTTRPQDDDEELDVWNELSDAESDLSFDDMF